MCVRAVAKRRNAYWNRTSECRPPTSEGMARQQRRLCAHNLDLMPAVVHSARQMAQVCQETFYESRWNCSSVLLAPGFMPDLTGGLYWVLSTVFYHQLSSMTAYTNHPRALFSAENVLNIVRCNTVQTGQNKHIQCVWTVTSRHLCLMCP